METLPLSDAVTAAPSLGAHRRSPPPPPRTTTTTTTLLLPAPTRRQARERTASPSTAPPPPPPPPPPLLLLEGRREGAAAEHFFGYDGQAGEATLDAFAMAAAPLLSTDGNANGTAADTIDLTPKPSQASTMAAGTCRLSRTATSTGLARLRSKCSRNGVRGRRGGGCKSCLA